MAGRWKRESLVRTVLNRMLKVNGCFYQEVQPLFHSVLLYFDRLSFGVKNWVKEKDSGISLLSSLIRNRNIWVEISKNGMKRKQQKNRKI